MFKAGELDEILTNVQDEHNITANNGDDNVAATQMLDDEFRALAIPEVDTDLNIFDVEGNSDTARIEDVRFIKLPPLISENDFLADVRSLNNKQRAYLNHILQNVVQKVKFYEYVGGGAVVVRPIYQTITHRLNSVPGSNPDLPKVLLTAPTGKAAFGIGGSTLHALFSLPVNQFSGELLPLSNDTVNSIIAKIFDLNLIIIDEISMVGSRMLGYLDARLKQIFKNANPFGGISVLAFGDCKQLPPVGDRWIFSDNTSNPYGAIVGSRLWDLFQFYELAEIMRQREDLAFAQALNRMSNGEMTIEDVNIFKSRIVHDSNDVPIDAIH
ncbi:uncharacterized protein LOC133336620 [Musca vetustissima]|uniref:uncharacterized protein LOC133336620 n=1 Tax=Musca vetustissima TaxID=27455 RepID=UPI002AB686E7|nr:uncharacterized protein LOC133336620 [Musca vetustissima]